MWMLCPLQSLKTFICDFTIMIKNLNRFMNPHFLFCSSIYKFILEGELSTLIYSNMSDMYLYICVCIDRSIVINNISKYISEAETQNYRNCKWKSNISVLNRSTSQNAQENKKTRTRDELINRNNGKKHKSSSKIERDNRRLNTWHEK